MRIPSIPKWISLPVAVGWLFAFMFFANSDGRDSRTISIVLGLAAIVVFVALVVDDRWFHARRKRNH